MTQKLHFRAVIKDAGGGGAYVVVPFDVEKVFGSKRPKIKASIDGEPYRGTLVRMGTPHHMLLVLKEIRTKIGKSFGDEISVDLEEDVMPREVNIPLDLMQVLEANPEVQNFFNRLSYTHQKEYVLWVVEAKRAQTRQERIRRMIELLKQGKREH